MGNDDYGGGGGEGFMHGIGRDNMYGSLHGCMETGMKGAGNADGIVSASILGEIYFMRDPLSLEDG